MNESYVSHDNPRKRKFMVLYQASADPTTLDSVANLSESNDCADHQIVEVQQTGNSQNPVDSAQVFVDDTQGNK